MTNIEYKKKSFVRFISYAKCFNWCDFFNLVLIWLICPSRIAKSKQTSKVWQQFWYSMLIRTLQIWDEPDINCNKQISEVARKLLRIIKQIWYSRHVHEGAVDKRKETFNIQHSSYPDRWSQNDMPKTSISLELLINEQVILNELGGISLLILICSYSYSKL